MTGSKNILIISPTPSHPQDAGNRKRIYALTKELQNLGHKIFFVYSPREWVNEIPSNSYQGMINEWDFFSIAYPVQPSVYWTESEYFWLDEWWDIGIEYTINWLKLSTKIDIVLCNYVFYSKVLELFDDSVIKIIDTHDVMSNRNYLLERNLGFKDFFWISFNDEEKALNRADLILSIKEEEADWFNTLTTVPTITIGHLEETFFDSVNLEISNRQITLGFIGSGNPINVKNLHTFLEHFLPLSTQLYPHFQIIIAGSICKNSNWEHEKVKYIGRLEDVAEFYDMTDIVLLPFNFSTGLKIKTIEALARGKACIGTINGFEGLNSKVNHHQYSSIPTMATGLCDFLYDCLENPLSIKNLALDGQKVYSDYDVYVKQNIRFIVEKDWKKLKNPKRTNYFKNNPLINHPKYSALIITKEKFWDQQTERHNWLQLLWILYRKYRNIHALFIGELSDYDKNILYQKDIVNVVHALDDKFVSKANDKFFANDAQVTLFIDNIDEDAIVPFRSIIPQFEFYCEEIPLLTSTFVVQKLTNLLTENQLQKPKWHEDFTFIKSDKITIGIYANAKIKYDGSLRKLKKFIESENEKLNFIAWEGNQHLHVSKIPLNIETTSILYFINQVDYIYIINSQDPDSSYIIALADIYKIPILKELSQLDSIKYQHAAF